MRRRLAPALLLSIAVAHPVSARVSAQAADVATPSVRELLQTARGQMQRGDRSGALESLGRARVLAPNSEEVLSAFAQVALAARMLAPAIATLDALTRMCSTVSQYHYLLGVALMEGGDMPAAIESLQQADRLEPERSLTLMARDLYTILFLHYKGVKLWTQIMPIALKEPSLWVPIPLFVAVVVCELLRRTSFTENRIYVICGGIFGLCTYAIWHVASWELWLAVAASSAAGGRNHR